MLAVLVVLLLLGASSASAAASSPEVTFYFGLERPESRARAAFFTVSQPGSANYRRFLGVRQVARRYGASARTVRAFRRAARRHGLVTRMDRSGVFARVRGTVKRFERVLGVRIRRTFDNDTPAVGWSAPGVRSPRLAPDLGRHVREVVASYDRSPGRRGASARGRAARAAQASQPGNAGTWTGGCSAARATGAYSFAQVRNAYGVDALGSGPRASMAIFNAGEGLPAQDIAESASCFGLPPVRPRILLGDGQARPFRRGSFEPQTDLALARGMAPGLTSLTLAQTWETPELWFLAPAHTLAAPRLPDNLSISYGGCERSIRGRRADASLRAGARLFDALALRLGLAGVGVFVAAGDSGSSCDGQRFAGVSWPASSPYVTAVGGTRLVLDQSNERVDEVVWNDLEWLSAENGGGAGGGGLAEFSRRAPFQRRLRLPGNRRAVPDISAHASLLPGWPVVMAGNWIEIGGTSASSPLLASAFAIISARERAAGRPPLGPVNGLVYSLQRSAPETFFDVVSGDNGYARGVPAMRAGPGYDRASGLGVPRFDRLVTALPPPAD